MRSLSAECRKLLRTRFVWVLAAAVLLIESAIILQLVANTASGIDARGFGDPRTVSALCLLLYVTILGIVPGVAVGAHLGARESGYGTLASAVVLSGRLRLLAGKTSLLLLFSAGFSLLVGVVGLGLGEIRDPQSPDAADVRDFLVQVCLGAANVFLIGLLAMTVASIVGNPGLADVILLLVLLGGQFIPGPIADVAGRVNPFYYLSGIAPDAFRRLDSLPFVAYGTGNTMSLFWNAVILALAFAGLAGVLVLTWARKEVAT
jgi:hypothetical protein